ncbi:MAG: hypothetical protein E3J54_03375, partial [Actinobacteria bacterium]
MNTQQAVEILTDENVKPQSKESVLRPLVLANTKESKEVIFKAFKNLIKKQFYHYKDKCVDLHECLETELNIIFLEALEQTRKQLTENPKKIFSTANLINKQFEWKIFAWYKDKYLSTKTVEKPIGSYEVKPYGENEESQADPWWFQELGGIGGLVEFLPSQFKEEKQPKQSQEELRLGKELHKYFYQ